ncbi:MAG TPA: RNA polymerase sigma factor [Acidimicrobiales bacterium]|nr:RNA polymerase sigma factor [Acidimicrobiales bacterium]
MALRADDVDLGRDRDLVERYQSGDPSAFDELYRRYFRRLHRFCQRHTRDVHEAEEIAQEAFVKALRSMDSLTGERRFYPWMTVIAKRLVIDRHRKLSRVELTCEPDLGAVEPDLDHLFDAVDAGHVRDALMAVGPRHREVLLLREGEGLSYAQIADHLEVPVTTVEALLHRARKALRREFAAVAGEGRGLWGLPLFGAAATRLGTLRHRLSERWVEAAAVGGPVLAGAVTAALVLAPAPADQQVQAAAPVDVERAAVVEPATEPAAVDAPVAVEAPAPAGRPSAPDAAADAPAPAAPAVTAGPADVFTGRPGVDRAADDARDMPVASDLGPAFAGLDPRPGLRSVADGLARALAAGGTEPSGTDPLGGTP